MTSDNREGTVEFKGVSLRYANASENSLDNVDFSVKRGETIGIIGGTGSGKTSLVNLIPRFYDVCEGEVLVDGINVKDYSSEALLEKIGIVPQRAVLFAGSIRDNMKWGNEDATDEEIIEAITLAQAKDVLDGKDGGLDFTIEQGGRNLSGGQRQRFTIARALVKKPEILIFDDSSSALDYATDARLRASLKSLDYNPTVFIVSQRTASIAGADKIIVLDDGKVVGIGTHSELLEDCVVYSEIYSSQFKKEGV
jgi:ABC-type multidrug transport system fused ATPase/permease subunit